MSIQWGHSWLFEYPRGLTRVPPVVTFRAEEGIRLVVRGFPYGDRVLYLSDGVFYLRPDRSAEYQRNLHGVRVVLADVEQRAQRGICTRHVGV